MIKGLISDLITGLLGEAAVPEFVQNPGNPFTSTDGINAFGTTLAILGDGNMQVTANDGASDRGEWAVSGLEIGATYDVVIEAEQGTGTTQDTRFWTWATISPTAIDGPMSEYTFQVTATAESGIIRIYASQTGNAGDTVVVKRVNVRRAA